MKSFVTKTSYATLPRKGTEIYAVKVQVMILVQHWWKKMLSKIKNADDRA
jgi:hypothetical protein